MNPVFTGVTIDKTMCDVVFSGGSFKGTYAYQTFDTENTSILFVGGDNLYWPEPDTTDPSNPKYPSIGAFRAYFDLGTTNAPDMNIVLNFGDTATGIENVQRSTFFATPHSQRENVQCNGAWFTLDGRKLQGQPTTKGIYIHGGRKVVVK